MELNTILAFLAFYAAPSFAAIFLSFKTKSRWAGRILFWGAILLLNLLATQIWVSFDCTEHSRVLYQDCKTVPDWISNWWGSLVVVFAYVLVGPIFVVAGTIFEGMARYKLQDR